jgi:restriction system protein
VDTWRVSFETGDRETVQEYYNEVLSKSTYPQEFPEKFKIAYVADSKQLVIEYDLPLLDAIIPKTKRFTYVKSSDVVNESPRPEKDRRILYASVIAQITLRCLHELFFASTKGVVETIVFNGFVKTIHPGTGQRIHPCLVTVRTTADQFKAINLLMAEPSAALQTLNASFSKSPAELAPVRPLLEFSMVDPRFIQESDVLSTLDQRRNLMDLSPGDFESLITNLFQKMGLETRLTQASRDGGVDCVAYDPRPIFGGKVVIQAKRYKNTVGVSAVRDLFGTMQNEGASKGILVATSGYGKAAFEFANGKPLELLDGSNLLFLLKEHAGIDARIVMPDDWKDPDMDSGA